VSADTVHEMDREGAHDGDGVTWLPRSRYTRGQARTAIAELRGCAWIDVRVLARHMVYAPTHPDAAEYDGDFWIECERGDAGSFPVWRCE
jgi:hypothetical protein